MHRGRADRRRQRTTTRLIALPHLHYDEDEEEAAEEAAEVLASDFRSQEASIAFVQLPREILVACFLQTDYKTLCSAAQVGRMWAECKCIVHRGDESERGIGSSR